MMNSYYKSIFITNIPSFYKLNLYNEINRLQNILVIFTGDLIQQRSSDFFDGKYEFDYINMAGWNILKKLWFVIATVIKVKYDEIVIGGWDSLPLILSAFISRKKKNSTVVESSAIESTLTGVKGFVKRCYFRRITKVYASGKSQAKLVRLLNPHINKIIITKGVGIFNIVKQPHYSSKQNITRFLYVGRLSEEKNLEFLIDVFNKHPNLTLNIVGYGELESQLRKIAKENINFLGGIANAHLSEIYQSNDVFILPSKVEPWGLVVEEALNNGLPLLLSNKVGCAEELLQNGVNGYSFVYDNEASLISAVEAIRNVETYNAMARNISWMDFEQIKNEQISCYIHG